jgi:uncharacterized protein YcaQ
MGYRTAPDLGRGALQRGDGSLSAQDARALALRAQGFGDRQLSPKRPIELLDRLGVMQLDSVSVLARPQEVVPFSRLGAFDVAAMHRAVYAAKGGFEYWGHEASWLPMADYRYFLPRMRRYRESAWWQRRMASLGDVPRQVLERIRSEGHLSSAAFEDPRPQRGTWWDRKPAKQALEVLFAAGELMCATRSAGFSRVYDLPERVLPPGLDTTDPGPEAATRYLLRRAVGAMGVATAREAADYYRLRPELWRPALPVLLEQGEIEQVRVEGWREPAYALPAALQGRLTLPQHRPAFLSPFDSLIWERGRTERLFGFHYRIEIYVPEGQRRYGYYVLPLLAQGRLIGRADLKHDRQAKALRVRGLWLEVVQPEAAATALRDLAEHLGATTIQVERCEPGAALEPLTHLLA